MLKRFAIGLLAAAIVLGLAVAKRHELLRFSIQEGARLATGYDVDVADLRVGSGGALLAGIRVASGASPLLTVQRVAIRYSLADLLPGSRHRFGLLAIDVLRPAITLTRLRDGRFDLRLPNGPVVPQPWRINAVPLRFTLRVRDARIDLREPFAYDESAKDVRVQAIDADARIDTAAITRYGVRGAFPERPAEPFSIVGRVDALRGYASHRARARYLPLPALANYFADTKEVRILGASATNFDARLYALGVVPNVTPQYHVSLTVDVAEGRIALRALSAPVERVRARLQVIDNAFYVRGATALLAGIPLRIEGGAYDFDGVLTGGAKLRLGIQGAGDLSGLRRAFSFARPQPISGAARLGVLVHGPIGDPVIVAQVDAPRAHFRDMPFEALAARVVYHSSVVALAPLQVRYGGVSIGARGAMHVGPHVQSLFALHVRGLASRLPYLNEMLGDEPIVFDATASGRDLLFHVAGSASSERGVSRMAALVEMNPDGTARVAPFWLHTARGDFDGGYALDRPHDTSAFWLIANRVRMRPPPFAAFPGLTLPRMPAVDARAIGMTIAGGGAGNDVALAGTIAGTGAAIAGVRFDRIDAAFGGTLRNAAMNRLRASGPWGNFDGNGQFAGQRFVAYGAYRGTFEGLQPFLGSAISGHGSLRGTVGVAIEPQRIVVQGSRLHMTGATLRGVPIDDASLTLAVQGNHLQIYSAQARAAGGDVVAAGTLSHLALVARRLHAAQLRGIGLPLTAGTLSATGALTAGSRLPSFEGGVAIAGGRVANFAVTGNGGVRFAGDAVTLGRVVGAFGDTDARVDGTIGSLTSGSPAYALDANVPAAGVASALHSFGIANHMTDGTLNARLRIGGRGTDPTIAGRVGVPAGDVNGLPFVDAGADLSADPGGVSLRAGRVVVGTTVARFDAESRSRETAVDVSAPRADLADFNNFFDTGDTLAGRGRVQIAAASRRARITSSGDVDVRGLRYRNLPLGDTRAVWSSARNEVHGAVAVGGAQGTLRARGSIAFEAGDSPVAAMLRSRYDVSAAVGDLDLSFWLPALGVQGVPITGRASGDATIRGRFPLLDLRATASVVGGTLGPLALDQAQFAVHAAHRRLIIDRAEMATPQLSASAEGSIGFAKGDPLDVRVHAATDRVAQLVYDVARVRVPVTGSFESTLSVAGTYRAPAVLAGFDATGVRAYGLPIAALFGELRLTNRTLVISNAGATLGKGEVTLAGALPLSLSPLRLAPADEPLNFEVDVVGLDPSIFDGMLGNDTKLGGLIDGHIGLSGTVRQPFVVGRLSLARGSYSSALERVPITQLAAALTFNRTWASLERATARLGSGTLAASGRADFPNGVSGGGSSLRFAAVARRAQLDLPAYGSGTLDARLALDKNAPGSALLSGTVTLSNAALPFSSFIKAAQQSGAGALPRLPLAFDLQASAGKNVRVRGSGYGAGLDIGTSGSVHLGGTLAAPTLAGSFASSGGTLTYFDRAFRVSEGSVRFNAADGVLPTLHAVATSSVVNPDPDRARNPYGSAEITITVDGPIAGLKIGLASNPSGYSRDEILGLLAPFGGFVNGIAFSRQSMLSPQQPGGITPLGALSPIPNVNLQARSSITVGQEAFNILNAQFASGLLAPVETTLGQGLGLSSVNLTLGYYGNVGLTASRLLGKAVSAVYAVTFGLPQIQSFGLVLAPNALTSATLNFFYQSGPTRLLQLPTAPVGYSASYAVGEPLIGNTGFSLTVQRYFW